MDKMTLIIGDKHLSSWSLRPWLLMKHFDLPFEEKVIKLNKPDTKSEIEKISPSGKVPLLIDKDIKVWDSLAIIEYLAEKFEREKIWPDSAKEKAWARSICSEMHSSFAALRKECSMNLCLIHSAAPVLSPELEKDVDRINQIFTDCRTVHRTRGSYLFGEFTAADAYFMPVISRIRTYRLSLKSDVSQEYYNFMVATPLFQKWMAEASEEMVAQS